MAIAPGRVSDHIQVMKLSVLDLAPVVEGATPAIALSNAAALAALAERCGYTRYWMAEHHNMSGIASAATAVCLAHVGHATKTIRIGSGGVMLPNHAPLVIAEQFGTLESLFPGRVDLGLGRAPGTDQLTMQALRRGLTNEEQFPRDVQEIIALFEPPQPGQKVKAVPGAGLRVPVWILGSSAFGAQLAAYLGLPYAFASHFAPDYLFHALRLYREHFRPSPFLDRPYAMAGIQALVAETDAEAKHLFTSIQMAFANMARGTRGLLKPPIDDIETYWTPQEKAQAQHMLTYAIVGSPATARAALEAFVEKTGVDEVIVSTSTHDFGARLRSFELLAEAAL
jgi:luciferase family oxidoreductase group 1